MIDSFTEQWTTKTFTNGDEVKMSVCNDNGDCDIMQIVIDGNEFWFPKSNAKDIAETLMLLADS